MSVLVAAWDEAACVERHLQSFLRLPHDSFELILCAGGSDGTYDLADAFSGPTVTVLRQASGEGKQQALRRCLERARGDLIYLADADTVFDERTVRAVLRPLLCGEAEAATGSVRPLPECEQDPFVGYQYAVQAYGALWTGRYSGGLHGANCALTRQALLDAGGFGGDAPTGTDYHLAQRLARRGARIRMVRAAAPSAFPSSLRDYRRQQSRWLRNLFLHGLAFGNRRDVAHVAITGLVGMLGLALPLAAFIVGVGCTRDRRPSSRAPRGARASVSREAPCASSRSAGFRAHGEAVAQMRAAHLSPIATSEAAIPAERYWLSMPFGLPRAAPRTSTARPAALAGVRGGRLLAPGARATLLRDGIWLAWAVLLAHSIASRLRYVAAARASGLSAPWSAAGIAIPMIAVDWASWALALLELLSPARRWRW